MCVLSHFVCCERDCHSGTKSHFLWSQKPPVRWAHWGFAREIAQFARLFVWLFIFILVALLTENYLLKCIKLVYTNFIVKLFLYKMLHLVTFSELIFKGISKHLFEIVPVGSNLDSKYPRSKLRLFRNWFQAMIS